MRLNPKVALVTREELLQLFFYDSAAGEFRWKKAKGGAKKNEIAGCVAVRRNTNYRVIRIHFRLYLAHHLVWFMEKGVWPSADIDHKDRNGENNKMGNLREATMPQNLCNTGPRSNNTSGFKGVWFDRRTNRWVAEIGPHWLGRFDTAENASFAYQRAAVKLYGEFANAPKP